MQRASVYPKVVLTGSFICGLFYGNSKQQNLYLNAINIVNTEDKEIEKYRTELKQKEEYERAKCFILIFLIQKYMVKIYPCITFLLVYVI
jgi:hypothetical protein